MAAGGYNPQLAELMVHVGADINNFTTGINQAQAAVNNLANSISKTYTLVITVDTSQIKAAMDSLRTMESKLDELSGKASALASSAGAANRAVNGNGSTPASTPKPKVPVGKVRAERAAAATQVETQKIIKESAKKSSTTVISAASKVPEWYDPEWLVRPAAGNKVFPSLKGKQGANYAAKWRWQDTPYMYSNPNWNEINEWMGRVRLANEKIYGKGDAWKSPSIAWGGMYRGANGRFIKPPWKTLPSEGWTPPITSMGNFMYPPGGNRDARGRFMSPNKFNTWQSSYINDFKAAAGKVNKPSATSYSDPMRLLERKKGEPAIYSRLRKGGWTPAEFEQNQVVAYQAAGQFFKRLENSTRFDKLKKSTEGLKGAFDGFANYVSSDWKIRGFYRIRELGESIEQAGMGLVVGVTGLGAIVGYVAGSYEQASNVLRANIAGNAAGYNSPSTLSQVGKLQALANGGMTTMYSPTQVIKAETEFVRAGRSAEETIKGINAVNNLAMIEMMGLDQATYIVSSTLNAFGKQVNDVNFVVDALSQASIDSSLTVTDLGHNLAYAAESAHFAGVSIGKTLAGMEAMAQQGINKQRIGIYMRGILDSLQDVYSDKKVRMLSSAYGIKIVNSKTGRLNDIDVIIDNLNRKFDKLNKSKRGYGRFQSMMDAVFPREQRNAMLAMMSANKVLEQGESWIDVKAKGGPKTYNAGDTIKGGAYMRYLTARNEEAGGKNLSQFLAGAQMGGLTGAFYELKNSLETLIVTIGENGLIAVLQSAVTKMTKLARVATTLVGKNPELVAFGASAGFVAITLGTLLIAMGMVTKAAGQFFLFREISKAFTAFMGPAFKAFIVGLLDVGIAMQNGASLSGAITSVFGAMAVPLAIVATVLALLAAAFAYLYLTCEPFKKQVDDIASVVIGQFIDPLVRRALPGIKIFADGLSMALNGLAFLVTPIVWAVRILVDLIGVVVYSFAGLFKWLGGDKMAAAYYFGKSFQSMAQIVTDTLSELVNMLYGFFRVLTGIAMLIISPFKMVFDILLGHSIIPDIVNGILYWFGILPRAIGKVLGGLLTMFSAPFRAIFDIIGLIFNPKIVGGLWKSPGKLISIITDALGKIWSSIETLPLVGFISGLFGGLGKGIDFEKMLNNILAVGDIGNGKLGYKIVGVFQMAFDAIWDFVEELPFVKIIQALFFPTGFDWEKIAEDIGKAFTSIGDAIKKAIDGFVEILGNNPIIKFIDGILEMLNLGGSKEIFGKFTDFFQSLGQSIKNFVKDVIDNVPGLDKIIAFAQALLTIASHPGGGGGSGGGGGTPPVVPPAQQTFTLAEARAYYMATTGMPASVADQFTIDMWRGFVYDIMHGIPAFARGGIITGPTLGLLGERGPEMVLPLPEQLSAPALNRLSTGGPSTINLTIELDGETIARKQLPLLVDEIRLRGVGI